MDIRNKKIVVTGGTGFVGRVVCDRLQSHGCNNVYIVKHTDYELTSELQVAKLYKDTNPDIVIHLAARVGGIGANSQQPGAFFYSNMAMGMHLIEHARLNNIEKFVYVGTTCSYPKFTEVPFSEDDLWDGFPEETNAPYGIAKRALIEMLNAYHRQYGLNSAVVIPANIYGPDDNFDLHTSHIIPAIIRKCVEAVANGDNEIICWGTGNVSREFLYVSDAAEGIVLATKKVYTPTPINLGTGIEIRINSLVRYITKLCGFTGEIIWDSTKPDGQPRRCLDTTKSNNLLGWRAEVDLDVGLHHTIEWYKEQINQGELDGRTNDEVVCI